MSTLLDAGFTRASSKFQAKVEHRYIIGNAIAGLSVVAIASSMIETTR